jgi:hypothetical protein
MDQTRAVGGRTRVIRFVATASAASLMVAAGAVGAADSARAVISVPTPVLATTGIPITPTPTVDVSGLVAPVTYTVTPTLPAGLSLDVGSASTVGTGVMSGTATAASPATSYTVTAIDSTPVTALVRSASLTISVAGVLVAPPSVTATLGQPIAQSPGLSVRGLGSPVTYTAPASPAWLHISAAGALSGTPDALLAATPITVTATDSTGAAAEGTFSLAVVPALVPATQVVTGTVGTPLNGPTPAFPASSTTTYAITPSLTNLTGLTFDTATGAVSGAPAHPIAATVFTVQRQAMVDGSVLAQGTISVTVDGVLGSTPQVITGIVGTAGPAFIGYGPSAATAAGLVAPFTFSTVPDLPGVTVPGDLSINAATGAISGRPTSAVAGSAYVVIATDKNGAKAAGPIVVNVAGLLLPTTQSMVGSVAASTYSKVLTASGMTAPIAYAITPQLPPGLLINPSTGVVSGIPRATQTTTLYEISATDANGAKATAKLTVTVGKALLSPPIIGSVIGGPTAGSLKVFFTAPRLAPTDQSYTVEVYDSMGMTVVASEDTFASPVTIDGLTPGETYQVVVVANASAYFDRVESQAKPGIASLGVAATATGAVSAATIPAIASDAAALSRGGIILATGGQTAAAKRVLAAAGPARSIGRAPNIRISVNSYSRIVIPGMAAKDRPLIRIRLSGTWVTLGTARINARHRLVLPAFAVRKAGSYPIQIASAGRLLFVRLVVSDATGAAAGG